MSQRMKMCAGLTVTTAQTTHREEAAMGVS